MPRANLCPNCSMQPTDPDRVAPKNSGTDGYCALCAADWADATAWAASRGRLPAPGALLSAYRQPLEDLAATIREALRGSALSPPPWGLPRHGLSPHQEQALVSLEEALVDLEALLAAGGRHPAPGEAEATVPPTWDN